ncbi:hypothetical protein C9926_02215 [Sulfurovum lithotrophicum]|nr:hypothetical protein C9926_02215 [Sulfurovum lithotrophicum]
MPGAAAPGNKREEQSPTNQIKLYMWALLTRAPDGGSKCRRRREGSARIFLNVANCNSEILRGSVKVLPYKWVGISTTTFTLFLPF